MQPEQKGRTMKKLIAVLALAALSVSLVATAGARTREDQNIVQTAAGAR